jgi:hypothetical protein
LGDQVITHSVGDGNWILFGYIKLTFPGYKKDCSKLIAAVSVDDGC